LEILTRWCTGSQKGKPANRKKEKKKQPNRIRKCPKTFSSLIHLNRSIIIKIFEKNIYPQFENADRKNPENQIFISFTLSFGTEIKFSFNMREQFKRRKNYSKKISR